jgi:hypothetical protein
LIFRQKSFVFPPQVQAFMQHLFIFLLIFVVLFAQLGCTDTDYRKATRAAAGIATGLGAVQDANESLYKAQLLDKDEARAIAQGVADAVRVNDQFVGRLRTLKTVDASNKQLVGLWFSEVLTSLEALNQQGVLRVKNADAKAKLSVIFAGVQSSAAILTQLMAANGIRVYAVNREVLIVPAFDLEGAAQRNMVTPDDVAYRRCPNRAGIVAAHFGGAL